MKKVIFILVCVLMYATSWGQETTQKETQTQDNAEGKVAWTELAVCQSCGMPMTEDLYGTDADGAANHEYCKYCYKDGKFVSPDMTMDEMIKLCVPFMVEQGMTEELANNLLRESLPKLKRWQATKKE